MSYRCLPAAVAPRALSEATGFGRAAERQHVGGQASSAHCNRYEISGGSRSMTTRPASPLHAQLAKASWVAPLLFIGANVLLRQVENTGSSKPTSLVISALAALLALAGILFGVAALCGIPRHGTKGILLPAVVGILLSSVF